MSQTYYKRRYPTFQRNVYEGCIQQTQIKEYDETKLIPFN